MLKYDIENTKSTIKSYIFYGIPFCGDRLLIYGIFLSYCILFSFDLMTELFAMYTHSTCDFLTLSEQQQPKTCVVQMLDCLYKYILFILRDVLFIKKSFIENYDNCNLLLKNTV